MTEVKRISGLDIVRTVAVIFVVAVHYFLYTDYYKIPISGGTLYIQTVMRWLFYTCVPLFIILTGYLKCNKKADKSHYKSIIHIIVSYLAISAVVIVFRKLYLNPDANVLSLILGVFNFSTDPYAWYIEMYIGLFLLIPFLNILYKNLDKKQKHLLIGTLFFLTSVSQLTKNLYAGQYLIDMMPDWWINIYPLTYYFIGCYIREYQVKLPKFKNLLAIIVVLFVQSTLFFFLSYGEVFNKEIWNSYGIFFTTILATLIFILLYDLDIKNKPLKFITKDIAVLSLDIYLLSYMADNLIYNVIKSHVTEYQTYLWLFFIVVPALFIFNYILANIKRLVEKIIKIIYKKIRKNR